MAARRAVLAFLALLLLPAAEGVLQHDNCVDEHYARDHYGDCCAKGAFRKNGHTKVCQAIAHTLKSAEMKSRARNDRRRR